MKRIMRAFKLNEISAVDRPAQAHAKVVLMKRDDDAKKRFLKLIEDQLDEASDEQLDKFLEAIDPTETVMTNEEFEKAVDAAVNKATNELLESTHKEIAKLQAELAIAKSRMSDEELPFHDSIKDEEARKEFRELAPVKRAEKMNKAIAAALPEHVMKQLAEAEDMKKRLALLESDKEVSFFAKRAVDLGLAESQGEILRKAYKGDAEAITKYEQIFKGLAEQVRTGKVFAEFGSNQSGQGATAKSEMDAVAAEYRKNKMAAGGVCTREMAFTAVYTDPAHADLKKRYDDEDFKKRHGTAA